MPSVLSQDFGYSGAALSGWRANEPAGMTMFTDRAFNSVATVDDGDTGPSEGWNTREALDSANLAIVTDSGAPQSPSNILEITHPAGLVGGVSPATMDTLVMPTGNRRLYHCYNIRPSASPDPWEGHPVENKFCYYWTDTDPAMTYYSSVEGGAGTTGPIITSGGNIQSGGASSGDVLPNRGTEAERTYTRGQWHIMEVFLVLEDDATGILRSWIDGVQIQEYTNIDWLAGSAISFWVTPWFWTYLPVKKLAIEGPVFGDAVKTFVNTTFDSAKASRKGLVSRG